MACGCGRSPDGCRGWHSLSEQEYKVEYEAYLKEKEGSLRVIDVKHYTDTLFKFKLTKPKDYSFKAGQFTMLNVDDAPKRAYSFTSGPQDNFIEFFSIKVPDGALTSKLKEIKIGDYVNVNQKATGNLLIENLTDGTDLWLLATGTGIAPFISMLSDEQTYTRFKNIHVVWSVRVKEELDAFDSFLRGLNIDYIPIVTRDQRWDGIDVRITHLIDKGIIMRDSHPETDKVMLCGNMDFNKQIMQMLNERNYTESSNRQKGSLAVEKAFVG